MKKILVLLSLLLMLFNGKVFASSELQKQHKEALALIRSGNSEERSEGIELLWSSAQNGYWRSAFIIGKLFLQQHEKPEAYFWLKISLELVVSPFVPNIFPSFEDALEYYVEDFYKEAPPRPYRISSKQEFDTVLKCQEILISSVKIETEDLVNTINQVERLLEKNEICEIQNRIKPWLKDFGFF